MQEAVHQHSCRKCGVVWQHPDSVASGTDQQRRDSHTCPACGFYGWSNRFKSGGEPDIVFLGVHKPLVRKGYLWQRLKQLVGL